MSNILFLLRYWPFYGGGETVTKALAQKFATEGHNVHILYLWNSEKTELFSNIVTHQLSGIKETEGYDIDQNDIPAMKKELQQYVTNHSIDIIINQWWPSSILKDEFLNSKVRIISCRHSSVLPKYKKAFNFKYLSQRLHYKRHVGKSLRFLDEMYLSSDCLVFLSKIYEDEYKHYSELSVNSEKLCAIYNPLPYSINFNIDEIEKKKKTVLFVGRMEEKCKKLERLLKAWKILNGDLIAKEWKLIIIGDGPDLSYNQTVAERLKLRNIEFKGYQNPTPYYMDASIITLTSDIEGWPMVIAEAQQLGVVPIVMNTYSAAKEIIESNRNGILVNSTHPKNFAKAMKEVMIDDIKRKELALNGIKDCSKYSIDAVYTQWMSLFNRLLQK